MRNFVVAVEVHVDRRHPAIHVEQHAERLDLAKDDVGQDLEDGLDKREGLTETAPDPEPDRAGNVTRQLPDNEPDNPDDAPGNQGEEQRPAEPAQALVEALPAHGREGEQGKPGIAVDQVAVRRAARENAGPPPAETASLIRAANAGDLQWGASPVSFSYQRNAGMSQLLPYIMPDWVAGVEEGSPQRQRWRR